MVYPNLTKKQLDQIDKLDLTKGEKDQLIDWIHTRNRIEKKETTFDNSELMALYFAIGTVLSRGGSESGISSCLSE